ncbi:phage minor head protein [Methanobrevibacter sp.]
MLDYFDMWDEFTYKSINDTKTMRYYNLITNLIDNQIDAGIRWLDSKEAEQYFKGETAYQKEVFQTLENEWDEILEAKFPSVESLLSEVYNRGKAKGYTDMRSRIRYTEQDKLALQFARDYNFGLIQRLNEDTIHQIKNTIISGFLAGDHPNTIAPKILTVAEERLEGSTFSPKQRATMIARTEVSRVQNTGILQSYVNEGYTEVKILTAEDNSVCDLCLRYAFEFNKDEDITFENRGREKVHNILKLVGEGNFPPFHPNCRCTVLSVWKTKVEPPENPPIIWLFPNTFFDFDEGVSTIGEKQEWTFDSLKKSLSDVVDPVDLEDVTEKILNFLDNIPDNRYEHLSVYDNDLNPKCEFKHGKKSKIKIPDSVYNFGKENGLGLTIHNHTSGVPFPSINDIVEGTINLKIKYNVIVTNKNRVVILKNDNVDSLISNNKQKRLVRGITEVTDLIDYDYKNSFLRREIIEEINRNPVPPWKKVSLLSNGRCDFTNKNFYKYLNILNKKFNGTHVSMTLI